MVELGVINATIHKVNDNVRVADMVALSSMYARVMELLLADPLFPRGGEPRAEAAYPADDAAGRPAALPLRGR